VNLVSAVESPALVSEEDEDYLQVGMDHVGRLTIRAGEARGFQIVNAKWEAAPPDLMLGKQRDGDFFRLDLTTYQKKGFASRVQQNSIVFERLQHSGETSLIRLGARPASVSALLRVKDRTIVAPMPPFKTRCRGGAGGARV